MKDDKQAIPFDLSPLPANDGEAVEWLMVLVRAADRRTLPQIPTDAFKRGWYSIAFLYPGLHPDSTSEHGTEVSYEVADVPEIQKVEPRLLAPWYVESGWPVVLGPVAEEAWQRYDANELQDNEFYCSEAVIAGYCHRSPDLAKEVREHRPYVADGSSC